MITVVMKYKCIDLMRNTTYFYKRFSFFQVKLDSLVMVPDSVLLPQINLLSSSKHKKTVQKRAFDVLLAIYKQLYEGVHNPKNLYENPKDILSRTPEELAKQLSK